MIKARITLLMSATFPLSGIATENAPQCPIEISGKLVQVQPIQPGWKGIAGSRFKLERATIVMGSPDIVARAELRGDEHRISRSVSQTIYSGLDVQREKWLVCAYGQGQDIEQAYRLADSVKQCNVRTSRNGNHDQHDVTVSCQ